MNEVCKVQVAYRSYVTGCNCQTAVSCQRSLLPPPAPLSCSSSRTNLILTKSAPFELYSIADDEGLCRFCGCLSSAFYPYVSISDKVLFVTWIVEICLPFPLLMDCALISWSKHTNLLLWGSCSFPVGSFAPWQWSQGHVAWETCWSHDGGNKDASNLIYLN